MVKTARGSVRTSRLRPSVLAGLSGPRVLAGRWRRHRLKRPLVWRQAPSGASRRKEAVARPAEQTRALGTLRSGVSVPLAVRSVLMNARCVFSQVTCGQADGSVWPEARGSLAQSWAQHGAAFAHSSFHQLFTGTF